MERRTIIALKCLQIDKIQVRSYHYEAVVSLSFLSAAFTRSATAAPKRTSPTLSPSFILRHQWLRESRKQLVHLFWELVEIVRIGFKAKKKPLPFQQNVFGKLNGLLSFLL